MKVTHALAAALLATTALGCSFFHTQPHIRYYTLTLQGAPATALDAPVSVVGFAADEPYASARLAYRSSPYRLDYYTYHRWAADPRNLLRATVRDYFEHGAAHDGLPYELEGNIRRLEEVDEPAGWQGALTLDIKVARGGATVLQRTYAETEPAAAKNAEAVAAAVSRALQRILDQVSADVAAAPRTGVAARPSAGR
ncbi:MAG TPA: ABC-type transport auxiliary lipoprotein family protein [Candidatus Binatia bacterium]|jgi:ABC-type uncharacterized transport system auxiliary subunit